MFYIVTGTALSFPGLYPFPFSVYGCVYACLYMYVRMFVCGGACRGPQLVSGTILDLSSILSDEPESSNQIHSCHAIPSTDRDGDSNSNAHTWWQACFSHRAASQPASRHLGFFFHQYFLLPPGERSQGPLPSTCYPFLNPTVLLQ